MVLFVVVRNFQKVNNDYWCSREMEITLFTRVPHNGKSHSNRSSIATHPPVENVYNAD